MPLHLVSNGQLSDASDVDQYYQLYNGGLIYDVKNVFNAKGDGQQVADGVMSSGSNVLTSASGLFAAGDVGKTLNIDGAGVAGVTLSANITGFTNATTITIATNASTAVSASTVSWGSDDVTPIKNAIAAAKAAGGGIVYFPAGIYMYTARLTITSSNMILRGAGKGLTRLVASVFGGQTSVEFLGPSSSALISNCALEDLTLDGAKRNNLTHLLCTWFDHMAIRRVKFINSSYRFFWIGTGNNVIENYNLLFEDCDFTIHANQVFETCMIINVRGVRLLRCIWDQWQYCAVSLYQLAEDVHFQDCIFSNSSGAGGTQSRAIIYKLSDNYIYVDKCRFLNLAGKGLESDGQVGQDLFGHTTIDHLVITRSYFYNCLNGFDIGSVTNFSISDNLIENCLHQGIVVGNGSFQAGHGVIRGNTIRNNGQGATLQYGIGFQSGSAYIPDADIDVVDNHIYDDQAAATQLTAVNIGLLVPARVLGSVRFRGNYLHCPTNIQVGVGSLGPDVSFKDNDGYNPVGRLTPPSLPATGLPLTNPFSVDTQIIVTGGTVTRVDIGATAAPALGPQLYDGGAAASALGAGSFSMVNTYLTTVGESQASPAASVTIASGDKISVAGVTPPTAGLVLSEHQGSSAGGSSLIAGSYSFAYTWFNEVGETTASPTTTITLPVDGRHFDGANITPPAGAVGARIYQTAFTVQAPFTNTNACTAGTKTLTFTSPPVGYVNGDSFTLDTAGLLETCVISSGAGASSTWTTLSAAITSTSATSITVASATGFPTSGQYMIRIDDEHLLVTAGAGTTTWTVTRGQDGTAAATHLISTVVNGGHTATWTLVSNLINSHSSGAAVAHVGTMPLGLIGIFGLQSNPPVILVSNLNTPVLSSTLPPSTSTAGISTPTGVTSMKFYFSAVPSGTSGFIVSKTPVNGSVAPFDVTTQGSGVAAPTVNTTGTNLGLLPPFSLVLPVGQSLVFTYSVAPTHLWFGN